MGAGTVRQCAILVGGLGTRLGELTAATPKPLLPVGDRPFLAWLMRELVRFGFDDFVLLTGYLSEVVEAALPLIVDGLPKTVQITVCREILRAGTGGALYHARDQLADRFLLCNGDSLLDFNLSRLLADASGDSDAVLVRMVVRQLEDASRYGVVELEGDRVTNLWERPAPDELGTSRAGNINAGIYLLRRDILADIVPVCSLERDVLPVLAAKGNVRATLGSGYFIDIGVTADLERAQTELPRRLRRRALFLNSDSVINVDHDSVGRSGPFEWMPGAVETVCAATNAGFHVFVVTNQSSINHGLHTKAQLAELHIWMARAIRMAGGTIDDLRYWSHPEVTLDASQTVSDWRKPAPGMLLDLVDRWEIDAASSLLISDQPSDLTAAAAAGIPGHLFKGPNLAAFALPLLG